MPKTLGTVTLLVRDHDEAVAWFRSALGFALVEDTPLGGGKRWVIVSPPAKSGARLLLAKADGPEQASLIGNQAGGRVAFFLYTNDFSADHGAMLGRGVEFEAEPRRELWAGRCLS
jgi:catechol 2,3-dioxygenase-like lactoylglutathione lyase family enzyme